MGPLARGVVAASVVLAMAACSVTTSLDDFVSPPDAGAPEGGASPDASASSSGSSGSSGDAAAEAGPCVAKSTGLRSPSAATQTTRDDGATWTAPGNARARDGDSAPAQMDLDQDESNLLSVSDFGFSIPSSSTLLGVRVVVTARQSGSGDVRDEEVWLAMGGDNKGANRGRDDELTDSFADSRTAARRTTGATRRSPRRSSPRLCSA